MFYSHQLLSKKGPFGQIWIAATVHPKMNRKRTDLIDIQESCMQIINPVVPLALRLSGILMGGIVRIYNHKVQFFYDDVTQFMQKMKTKPPAKSVDETRLSSRKTRAKHEAITLDSFEDDEFEHPMLQPETPIQDDEFFTVPSPVRKPVAPAFNRFQAENEDITLEEDNMRSFNSGLDDSFSERADSEGRFQLPENFIDDGFYVPPDEEPGASAYKTREMLEDSLEPIVEEPTGERIEVEGADQDQRTEAEVNMDASNVVEEAPNSPEPEKPRKRRKSSKRQKKLVIDDELTEIPVTVFQSWLTDSSSIIHRKSRRKLYTGVSSEKIKVLFENPSTFISCANRSDAPQSLLSAPLKEMWKRKPSRGEQPPTEGRETRKRRMQFPESAQESSEQRSQEESKQTSDASPVPEDLPPPTFEFEEPEQFNEAPQSFEDFGSVEKLRSVARTPLTGSEDNFFDSQMGFTPTYSGNNSTMNSMLRRSSQSDKLLPDDFSTPRRSKKSRRRDQNSSPLGPDVSSKEFFPETRIPDISVMPEAEPSRAVHQRQLDKLTSVMLQYLREHFVNTTGVKDLSLDDLTEGMDPCQAAKMFYHVCVLASNRYLTVNQKKAYGDIIVSKGSLF